MLFAAGSTPCCRCIPDRRGLRHRHATGMRRTQPCGVTPEGCQSECKLHPGSSTSADHPYHRVAGHSTTLPATTRPAAVTSMEDASMLDRLTMAARVVELPIGTITFLLSDIRDSVRLWEADPDAMEQALVRHDWIVEHGVAEYDGTIIRSRGEGDSHFAVFSQAAAAALAIQQTLIAEMWATPEPLQVRLALHTGDAGWRRGDYYGSSVNLCARLRALAHGEQILVSKATEELVRPVAATGGGPLGPGHAPLEGVRPCRASVPIGPPFPSGHLSPARVPRRPPDLPDDG